jgi:hypothetical protein
MCYSFCYSFYLETVCIRVICVRNLSVRRHRGDADVCGYARKCGIARYSSLTLERHEIEGRDAMEIADDLKQAYDRYCGSDD